MNYSLVGETRTQVGEVSFSPSITNGLGFCVDNMFRVLHLKENGLFDSQLHSQTTNYKYRIMIVALCRLSEYEILKNCTLRAYNPDSPFTSISWKSGMMLK